MKKSLALPIAGACVLTLYAALGAQSGSAPRYKFDPDWPKPLPNKWKMGGVTGLAVDSQGFVYIGQDTVRKYDPKTGKVVGEVPRAPESQGGGGGEGRGAAARVPGRGTAGPTGTFPQQGGGRGRGNPDAAAQAAAAQAAFRAKYPPTTPMIVGQIEEIRLDEPAEVLGQMGSMGENGGQWFGLHMIAVDSKGNIYTGEVFNGERVQRFVPVN